MEITDHEMEKAELCLYKALVHSYADVKMKLCSLKQNEQQVDIFILKENKDRVIATYDYDESSFKKIKLSREIDKMNFIERYIIVNIPF